MDISETEFYIDSDVFLLKYPEEVDDFIKNPKLKFVILDEFKGQSWQHGAMHKKGVKEAPFVNAGFFIQKAGYSISDDLLKEKKWWEENISKEEQKHHDEQGCLAISLSTYLKNGELYIFPKDKYMLIGPNENKNIESLEDVTMFHAVYPHHPDFNISYHLDLGFDYIFIANHCSTDGTSRILDKYKDDKRVVVIDEKDPMFDHAKITNKLLTHAKENYEIDWFIFLDADEFLSVKDKTIHEFVERLEDHNIPYATIGWANALFDYTMSDYTCSPVTPIDTTKYYFPWPEKSWQEGGHFRKTIVRNHDNIEVVVGGHYVETGNNVDFFGEYHWNPFIVPYEEAKILHFEFRGKAKDIYDKWKKLADYENDSTSDKSAPWMERINTIRGYVEEFKDNIGEINEIWFRKYFRNKIENGEIKTVCLVRDRNLGDVVMTEPIAKFLSKYVDKVYLATDIDEADLIFNTYDNVYQYKNINSIKINCDAKIKLIYELSDNKKSCIQGYMDSIGFSEIANNDLPKINQEWENIINEEYILLAPFTSSWEEQKRNWGYKKYKRLQSLLEDKFMVKCVILENEYSFQEMMSLIRHCKFFVGNDSGPAVIAQSLFKKSFNIFGATSPKYLHLSHNTTYIYY